MIKINLSNAKKNVDISNIAGFDFTRLKIKALLLVILIIYIPDLFLYELWENERMEAETTIGQTQRELSKLKREVSKSIDLEKQIRELKAQEENLGKKLTAVKQAISEKKNPSALLLYIAKNIPPELWIKELSILQDEMVVKGDALDYTSIGNFVTMLKESVFVGEANITSTSSAVREIDKRRIESFEVKFKISRFDQ
jgi:Tfp pilus assembly protein PilN